MKQFKSIALALLLAGCRQAAAHDDHEEKTSENGFLDTWRASAPLPVPLSDMSANTVGDKVYIFGGCSGDQLGYTCPSISSDVFIYDPAADSFDTLAGVLPRERYRHAAAVVGTKVYLLGGRDLNDDIVEEVDVFDTADQTWTMSWEWTSAQSDNDAFVRNGKVYVVGGYDAAYTAQDDVDILDTDDGWTLGSAASTIAAMTVARGDFAVVHDSSDDKVYAFGGWSDSNGFCAPLTSAEVYDPSADAWTALGDLAVGRGDKASGLLHGRVFAVGGESTASCDDDAGGVSAVTDVEAYDPDTDTWEVVAELPEAAFRFASATWRHTIYVFGGQQTARFCAQHNATCNPLVNATWGFTEEYDHSSDGLSAGAVAGVALACLAVAAGLAAAFHYRAKLGCGPSTATPTEESVEAENFKKFKANDAGDFEATPTAV